MWKFCYSNFSHSVAPCMLTVGSVACYSTNVNCVYDIYLYAQTSSTKIMTTRLHACSRLWAWNYAFQPDILTIMTFCPTWHFVQYGILSNMTFCPTWHFDSADISNCKQLQFNKVEFFFRTDISLVKIMTISFCNSRLNTFHYLAQLYTRMIFLFMILIWCCLDEKHEPWWKLSFPPLYAHPSYIEQSSSFRWNQLGKKRMNNYNESRKIFLLLSPHFQFSKFLAFVFCSNLCARFCQTSNSGEKEFFFSCLVIKVCWW